MLRDELRGVARGLNVARPTLEFPLALFTAYLPDATSAAALKTRCEALGLSLSARGSLGILQPEFELCAALAEFEPGCARNGDCEFGAIDIARVYPAPAALDYERRALLRETRRLRAGQNAQNASLFAQGLRLLEGPSIQSERRAYQKAVRQAAALAIRTDARATEIKACAVIIALGGMTYEA